MDPETRFGYTREMTESEIESCLRDVGHGVLSLADGDDGYAIPLYHHYEDGRLFFRLGETATGRKADFIETTATATYVVHEAEETPDAAVDRAWSVVARGPLEPVPEDHAAYDLAAINERFGSLRLFDEPHDQVELTLYELRPEQLTGRQN